ncbi:MAG TPA: DUF3347 domain-containing protein [Ignavibacteria bacterium]|jgi:uncharacterized coiled-coil DUF342 family protein
MKTGIRYLALLLFITFFISCSKKTEQDVKKTGEEVKKNIDTASQKLGHELDTLVNKITGKDSLFDNAKITKVDGSKLPKGEFRKKLNDIFDEYDDISGELSENDPGEVNKQASQLKRALTKAQSDTASEKLGPKWKTLVSSIEKIATNLENTKDLQKQRALFADLSNSIEDMVKSFGVYNKTLYKLRCSTEPGKFWLTDSKVTDNPYFGEDKANEKSKPCLQVVEAWKFD